nr:hypothetical protein [Tanacetum cinerariifolium]
GKLRDRNAEESWTLLEDLTLYDNKSWNDPRDFAKPVKAISLPQDVPRLVSNFMASQDAKLSKFEADFKQKQSEMTNKIDTVLKSITYRMARALPSDTVKNPKLNVNTTTSALSGRSYPTKDLQYSTHIYGFINIITIHPKQQSDSRDNMAEEEEREREGDPEDTNTIAYYEELMCRCVGVIYVSSFTIYFMPTILKNNTLTSSVPGQDVASLEEEREREGDPEDTNTIAYYEELMCRCVVIFMDTAYDRRWIRRIGNCEYAFSCEDLALIRRISFPGYGVLVRNEYS